MSANAKHPTTNPQEQRLDDDYRAIATLMAQLDEQSASFSGKMDKILDKVPAHDGLAALWTEQAEVLKSGGNDDEKSAAKSGEENKNENSVLMDEELSDQDEVILL